MDEAHILTTHESKNVGKAIEDIFNRDWYLKEIFGYKDAEIKKADAVLSKEMQNQKGGAKYIWAKKLFEKTLKNVLTNARRCAIILER